MILSEASLLRLYVSADDRWHHQPLYQAVVEKARAMDMAGASVFGVELGYGANHQLHDAKSEYTSFNIPVVVEIIDAPDRVEAFLLEVGAMVKEGLVTVSPVRVVRSDRPAGRDPTGG